MAIEDLGGGHIRKCLVKKWSDFAGYGFNLHAEKGKAGQYIGKVDESSPAEAAGLKEGDRIVEVNDVNIGNENHQQVVTRIKSGGDSVWLLVVDNAGDTYCKNNKIIISNDLDEVKVIECPNSRNEVPSSTPENGSTASTVEVNEPPPENDYETPADLPPPVTGTAPEANSVSDEDDGELPPPPPELFELDAAVNSVSADPAAPEPLAPEPDETEDVKVEATEPEEPAASLTQEPEEPGKPSKPEEPEKPSKPEEPAKPVEPAAQNGSSTKPKEEVVPKMSAAEMKEALAKKKKNDPRNSKLSAKDKLKMFQNL